MRYAISKLWPMCLVLIAPFAHGALPASDSFTASGSDQALTAYSANWSYAAGSWQVVFLDGAAGPNSSGNEVGAFWNADSFSADQKSTIVVNRIASGSLIGPGVRMSSSNYYGAYSDTSNSYLFKVVSGTWTQLDIDTAWSASDSVELSVVGTTLTVKVNGTTTMTATDSSLSSGAAGITGYGGGYSTANISSWTGDNISGSAATLSSPTPSGTLGTTTTATVGATTNQSSGTLYVVVDSAANLSGVTATQIKAGQKASGTSALASCNASVSTSTPSCGVTGLTASTAYSYAEVQNNTNGDSNIVTGTFTTASGGGGGAAVPVFFYHYRTMKQ